MKSFGFKSAGAVCALALAVGTASAQEVNLKSPNGTIDLKGELVGFDDAFYIIRTNLGELRVAIDQVDCVGAACPTGVEEPAPVVLASVEQTEAAVEEIAIAGSETIGVGLMRLLLEGFAATTDAEALPSQKTGPRTNMTTLVSDGGFGDPIGQYVVTSRGSASAFGALQSKSAQIGMTSRRILPIEARELRADGAGNMVSINQEHIIGVDSLVVVAHPGNPVDNLTLDQLGKIYSGAIKNWSEVGGNDADILVIDRPEKSGTRDVLAEVFEAAVVSNISPLEVRIANDSNKAAELVRENENAIGFLGYAFQRGTKALALINECNQPMIADSFSARTEEYPLQRRLYLYNRADVGSEQVKDFVTFAASPQADPFITKSGFIGLGIETRPQPVNGERAQLLRDPKADSYEQPFMQDMMNVMVDYDRLSTTFRFRTASSKLDERGRVDMQRLVTYLEQQPTGTDVLFVGFTDDVGPFDNNLSLAEQRANDALAAFRAAAGDRASDLAISARGFGEIAPSGCNLTDGGRQINRRVEVWIKAS